MGTKHTYYLIKTLFFILLFSQVINLNAQKKADHFYEQGFYAKAAALYAKKLKKDTTDALLSKLAKSYLKVKNYDQAEHYFSHLAARKGMSHSQALSYLEVLKNNSKWQDAKQVVAVYAQGAQQQFLADFDQKNLLDQKKAFFSVDKVHGINTKGSEYGVIKYKDSSVIFVSDRIKDLNYYELDQTTLKPYYGLFKADLVGGDYIDKISKMKGHFQYDYHIGPITFDSAYQVAVFNKIQNLKKGPGFVNKPQLYISYFKSGRWTKPQGLVFNDLNHSYAHPSLSKDGKTLVFSSDLKGSKDLYVSYFENGQWKSPERLSSEVNSPKDEVFPFLKDDSTLFFASNGFQGLGGLDLYVSHKTSKGWSDAQNLRRPINSNRDDFSIVFFDEQTGYFASDRKQGLGKDDIYRFQQIEALEDKTDLKGVFFYSQLKRSVREKLLLYDLDDQLIDIAYTDDTGAFVFRNVDAKMQYSIRPEKAQHPITDQTTIELQNLSTKQILVIKPNEQGAFMFNTLPLDTSEKLVRLEAVDHQMFVPVIQGKVYTKLSADKSELIQIALVDESGKIIQTVFADQNGNFTFKNLPLDRSYRLQVLNAENSTIDLFDAQGRLIAKLKDSDKGFVYSHLQKDAFALSLLENLIDDQQLLTSVNAMLKLEQEEDLPVKLILYDDQNHALDTLITDQQGRFELSDVQLYKSYKLKVEGLADQQSLSEIFIQNDQGVFVQSLYKEGAYHYFTALTREEYGALQPLVLDKGRFIAGKVYEFLPGDVPAGLSVYLLNDQHERIEQVALDEYGNFRFQTLAGDKQYLIELDERISDFAKLFVFDAGNQLSEAQRRKDGSFEYKFLKRQIDFLQDVIEHEKAYLSLFIKSQQKFEGSLQLLDDQLNTIRDLSYDHQNCLIDQIDLYKYYHVRCKEVGQASLIENMFALNSKQEKVMPLLKVDDQTYKFYALHGYEYDALPTMTIDEQQDQLMAHVYSKLSSSNAGLQVFLLDAQQNIIDSTQTLSSGAFRFARLSPEKKYFIKVLKTDSTQGVDFGDQVGVRVVENSSSELMLALNQPSEPSSVYRGRVYKKLAGDLPAGLKMYLLDDSGNVIDSTYIDEKGSFVFKNLPKDHGYKLFLQNTKDEALVYMHLTDKGSERAVNVFTYKQLKAENSTLTLLALSSDDSAFIFLNDLHSDTALLARVFHLYDSDQLDESSLRNTLPGLLDKLKNMNVNKLLVRSYTDPKGSFAYNLKLSKRRANKVKQFFIQSGLKIDVETQGMSERYPWASNYMPDGSDNWYGRKVNRRSEILLIKKTK